MKNKFDELTKGVAQSVTRRKALKKFSLGLAGIALASFGLANISQGKAQNPECTTDADCAAGNICCNGACTRSVPDWCDQSNNACCCHCSGTGRKAHMVTGFPECHPAYPGCVSICGYASIINPKAC